jgi:hypothetical protein
MTSQTQTVEGIATVAQRIDYWPIDRLVAYARNPRKNDSAVDRMCSSIREFGFKIPCLVRISNVYVTSWEIKDPAESKMGGLQERSKRAGPSR